MSRRLLVCLLLVTAGCNTLVGGGGEAPTATVTPAPVPAEETVAPGVTDEGVRNPRALADAHADVLAAASYRLTANRTVRAANGTLRERLTLELALAADRSYRADAATAGPAAPVFLGTPPATATFWSNGSTYVRKLTRDDRTTYNSFTPVEGAGTWQYWARTVPFGGQQATPRAFLRRTFRAVDTDVVGRTEANGTTTYLLRGNATTERLEAGVSNPRNVSLTATVTEQGLVASLSLRYVGTVNGERVRVVRTVSYSDVGATTVDRPPWFDRATD